MQSCFVTVPEEFSFKECCTFLNRSPLECLHTVSHNRIRKLIKTSDRNLLIEISSNQNLKNKLKIKFLNCKVTLREVQSVKKFINEWFDLNTDLKPFYKFAKKDKLLREIVKKYYGLRLIGIPDIFEAISWAIIGQQINLSFAFKMKRNFVEKFGEKFSFENKTYFLYPKPEIVSKLKVSDLLKLQFSRQKAEYVIEAAKTLTDFEISEAYKKNLTGLPLIEAKEILCKIRGVGNWTANYALMKCLRNPDAFPIEDVGLHNAIKNILGLDSKPSVENIRKLSAKWKGWYSYSVFYLWRSLLPD